MTTWREVPGNFFISYLEANEGYYYISVVYIGNKDFCKREYTGFYKNGDFERYITAEGKFSKEVQITSKKEAKRRCELHYRRHNIYRLQ